MSKRSSRADGPLFRIDNEVTRCIRQHARAHMKTEVCGVMIGENRNGVIEVQASIEALNAAQAGTHVTFTQDAWEAIYRIKDESYPEERIVGWYHSHPGFGVFLSEHDTFIHRNFFSSPDQVAWVYDPHTDEEGCFGWVDGDIHRISSFSIVDNNGDGVERTPKEIEPPLSEMADEPSIAVRRDPRKGEPAAWLRWSVTALSHLSAILLGFVIAYFLFPRLIGIPVDPITHEPLDWPSDMARPDLSPAPSGAGVPAPVANPPSQPSATAPGPNSGGSK